jgi:hypothetical protein
MVEQFLDECDALIAKEHSRPSIPMLQALLIMYLTRTLMGRDKAATGYRTAAYEMLNRLDLEHRYSQARDANPPRTKEMNLVSKTLWGMFILEK